MCAVACTMPVFALGGQHEKESDFSKALGCDFKGKLRLGTYAAAIPLAFWMPFLSLALIACVALCWIAPDRRFSVDRQPAPESLKCPSSPASTI